MQYQIHSSFSPAGDQPLAINKLCQGIQNNLRDQVLLGVTGSGKTFTMAHVIAHCKRPALIMVHNKMLAAQIYEEMKFFFPNNAVEYFISYYDYFQPEAYIARTDTFIEKDAVINEKIDMLRHSATRSLLERRDVIVVASISCIYGLGSPELYLQSSIKIEKANKIDIFDLAKQLVAIQYTRNDRNFRRGTFRIRGDVLDIFPSHYESMAWRISVFGSEIEGIVEFNALTGELIKDLDSIIIFANSHYIIPRPTINQAVAMIKDELKEQLAYFHKNGQIIEEYRLKQRTAYDLEMISETGSCKGIENYSRYLSGKQAGEPPPTLLEYMPKDSLLFVDESHITVPQIRGMYNGNLVRKNNLIQYGFRLPSALDNRPLKFEEWDEMRPQTIYVSATPGPYELAKSGVAIAEQIVRPTGLIDPQCIVRPVENQIDDLINECQDVIKKDCRVLITVLTKKMAEHLCRYMQEMGMRTIFLHSDTESLERIVIINNLRKGIYDILIGVNLLREGLDIPECGLVVILDADKEGFLRSETSLIQTIGRAARNIEGKVIMYADTITKSIQNALSKTTERRNKQIAYNTMHKITPKSIKKEIHTTLEDFAKEETSSIRSQQKKSRKSDYKIAINLEQQMQQAAANLDFEKAIALRNELEALKLQMRSRDK